MNALTAQYSANPDDKKGDISTAFVTFVNTYWKSGLRQKKETVPFARLL
jgi:hypothetical protein